MNKLQITLRRERIIKALAVCGLLGIALTTLLAVPDLLASFVLAFVINYLLSPIVELLERKGLSRNLATLIPFVGTGLLIGFCVYLVFPLINSQIISLEHEFPKYQKDLVNLTSSLESRFKLFFSISNVNVSQAINEWLANKVTEISQFIPAAISHSITVLSLSPFFAFFMLQDGKKISNALLAQVPNNLFELALHLVHQINEQMGGFIRARFIEAAIVGSVVWLGLQIISFPYATLLALFAALTNLIPYLGPIIGAVPAVLMVVISDDPSLSANMGLSLSLVVSVYFVAQLIDIIFIIPLVVAKIVNLHPVTVMIVIIVGAQLLGIIGMIISIPVASVVKLTFSALYNHLMQFRT